MELRFIYGESGTGKTTHCFSEIKSEIENAKKIYIITPEQFSFTAEKRLLEIAPNNATVNAEVITFNRMAQRVFTEVGGASKTVLTECGNAILISDILESKKKELNFLGKSEKNIELVARLFTELKKHEITLEILEKAIENTENMYLKYKLQDVYILFEEYETRLENKYIDSNDLLTKLIENLDQSKMFDDSIVYIDEFAGFTSQEYTIIKKILQKAKRVNITICTDWLENTRGPEGDIYYQNKITAKKLVKLAEEGSIKAPVALKKKYRFKNIELSHLAENLYCTKAKKYYEEPQNIHMFLANNISSEIEYVAKEIIKLVRDKNYKYKDIAVITKKIENYSAISKVVFEKYNIPIFIDEKKDLNQNLLIKYILSIFDILSNNFSHEAVFSYLKTGLLNINEEDLFKLENYCIKWGIKGNKWYKKDWEYGNLTAEELTKLNEIRTKITNPLLELKEKIKLNKTVEGISKDIYSFILENEILEKIKNKIEDLSEEKVAEYETGINVTMQVLDELVMLFGDKKISFEKYYELLKIGFQNKDVGIIPEAQDQVTLGDVDRTRSHNVKSVFIIGINDGVFPGVNKDEGFLNDSDRESLKMQGIELAKTTTDRLYEEQFNVYKALTIAEEQLYLSYTGVDLEGKALRPSVLIAKVKKIFPELKLESDIIEKEDFVGAQDETFDELLNNLYKLSNGEKINPIWLEVYKWFNQNEKWHNKLQRALDGLNYTNLPENIDEKNIEQLYGDKMKTSISKLEQYRRCPFSFHLKYGLNLKENEKFEIKSVDTGSFMHEIIDGFFEKAKNKEIDIKEISEKEIENIVHDMVLGEMLLAKNAIFTSSKKFEILIKKLKKVLTESIKYIVKSLQDSKFEILGNEIEFKHGGEYEPIKLKLSNGKEIELTGKIDRVDIAENEDGKFVRIIDYKSSVKNIELNEVMFGMQLQLITYLDEIVSKKRMIPAGTLYFNLTETIIPEANRKTAEEIEREIRKSFKMKGLILADINVVKMMDTNLDKGYSELIPAFIDKEGNLGGKTNAINKEDFVSLQKKVRKIIKQISEEIYEGEIGIKPYYNKEKQTECKYCSYKTICNFNTKQKGNNYNYIKYLPKEEVLEKIRKEAGNV